MSSGWLQVDKSSQPPVVRRKVMLIDLKMGRRHAFPSERGRG